MAQEELHLKAPRLPAKSLARGGNGEGGIRTHGTFWVHTLSRRAVSSTHAPLRNFTVLNGLHEAMQLYPSAYPMALIVPTMNKSGEFFTAL